jgi:inhibitor of cysteine peptidase
MRLVFVCITVFVLACANGRSEAVAKTITAADVGQPIHLRVGEEFVLNLRSNPSTGYSWFLTDTKNPVLISLGKPTYTHGPSMPGAGGIQSWNFRAVERGAQPLKLEYRRPWEKKVAGKTAIFQVIVQ